LTKPNLVFILIDALRARNLGCYGHNVPTSPFIDFLAKKGTMFTKMFSVTNATDVSLTSIFTGLLPKNHGIRHHADQVTEEEKQKAKTIHWLPEILKREGYNTVAIDSLERWHKRGFDYYDGRFEPEKLKQHQPFFIFLHYWTTHYPLEANERTVQKIYEKYYEGRPEPSNEEILEKVKGKWKHNLEKILNQGGFNWRLAKYDASILGTDEAICKIYNYMEGLGLDNTYWIITSDHGESLGEHDIYFDHHGLYDTTVHVPLILTGPDIPHKKCEGLLSQIELFPTILELLDIENTYKCDGVSLVDNWEFSRRFVEFEESYTQVKFGVRTERFKFISSDISNIVGMSPSALGFPDKGEYPYKCRYCGVIHGGIYEFYDLKQDPGETNNLLKGIVLNNVLKEVLK